MNQRDLQVLRRAGLLSARQYLSAAHILRDEGFWARWGRRALLALGTGQFLAGIVLFFAYNWRDFSDVAKFAVIESGIALTVAAALIHGIDKAFGQALLIGASVLTGVLLAVIGQAYQTGADVFELFMAWAALILPWTIASRSAAQWLLWLIVAEVALWLYGEQVPMVVGDMTWEQLSALSGATVATAMAAREAAVRAGCPWLAADWTRLVLLFAVLAILFLPAAGYMLAIDSVRAPPLAVGAFATAAIAAGYVYWRKLPDFAALVIIIGFANAFVLSVGYRLIEESIGFSFSESGPALASTGAMIAWAIAATGGAALAMRHLRAALRGAPA